jgi:hypothetical protein
MFEIVSNVNSVLLLVEGPSWKAVSYVGKQGNLRFWWDTKFHCRIHMNSQLIF